MLAYIEFEIHLLDWPFAFEGAERTSEPEIEN